MTARGGGDPLCRTICLVLKVRLHEYVDVFAALALPKLPWPRSPKQMRNGRGGDRLRSMDGSGRSLSVSGNIAQEKTGSERLSNHARDEGWSGQGDKQNDSDAQGLGTPAPSSSKPQERGGLTRPRRRRLDHAAIVASPALVGPSGLTSGSERPPQETGRQVRGSTAESAGGYAAGDRAPGSSRARDQSPGAKRPTQRPGSRPRGRAGPDDDEETSVRPKRYSPLVLPPAEMVKQAKLMLGRHFLVGLTEDLPGFLALLSLELKWGNSSLLCLPYPCQLKQGGGDTDCGAAGSNHLNKLAPKIRGEIDRLVAPDLEVYNHAVKVFNGQAKSHGSKFLARKNLLVSEAHASKCNKIRPSLQATCKQL